MGSLYVYPDFGGIVPGMLLIRMLFHSWRHGAFWYEVSADRPTRRHGTVVECQRCGARWLSRYPWDRKAGF